MFRRTSKRREDSALSEVFKKVGRNRRDCDRRTVVRRKKEYVDFWRYAHSSKRAIYIGESVEIDAWQDANKESGLKAFEIIFRIRRRADKLQKLYVLLWTHIGSEITVMRTTDDAVTMLDADISSKIFRCGDEDEASRVRGLVSKYLIEHRRGIDSVLREDVIRVFKQFEATANA